MADGIRVQEMSVRFFTSARLNRNKSDAAGRPIFDDLEMVEIRFPNDDRTVVTAPSTEETSYDGEMVPYYRRFAKEYEAYKSGDEDYVDGTRIEEVGFLTEAQKAELRAVKVRTVEQLAAMSGRGLYRLGPNGTELKEKAEVFLQRAESGKAATEADELRRRVAELEAKLNASRPMEFGKAEDAAPVNFHYKDDHAVKSAGTANVFSGESVRAVRDAKGLPALDASGPAEIYQDDPHAGDGLHNTYVGPDDDADADENGVEEDDDGYDDIDSPIILDRLTEAELKAYVKDLTGETPRGNPSRETLMRQAKEAQTK